MLDGTACAQSSPRLPTKRQSLSSRQFKAANRIPKAANKIAEWADPEVLEHAEFDLRFFQTVPDKPSVYKMRVRNSVGLCMTEV